MNGNLVEVLETRQLLSGAVGPATVFDSAVRTDETYIFQDFKKFKTDGLKYNNEMYRVAIQIYHSDLRQAPTVKSELVTFTSAEIPADNLLHGDNLHESNAVVADEKAILNEQAKLAHDKNNATAQAADLVQLKADRTQVKSDLDSLLQTRFTARESDYNTLLGDVSPIISAINADTQAPAKLTALASALNTDATNCGSTLSADLQQASTDASQLDTDLTASASQQ